MTIKRWAGKHLNGHRIMLIVFLCLFGLCLSQAMRPSKKHQDTREKGDRVYLLHADELYYDQWGDNPEAQILKGKVKFSHQGGILDCDSAYFFQASNSFQAFGHVHYYQGDTLSLNCDRAEYDGMVQMMRARHHVVLRHRTQTLRTDSLDYDRLYNYAYFFEGGTLVDGKDRLVADWGEYYLDTRLANFYYNVKLRSGEDLITTDTLFYDLSKSLAHVTGPSRIVSKNSVINTDNGFYDSDNKTAQLYQRSTVNDNGKNITADTLFYVKNGESEGFGNVVYEDTINKNGLTCEYFRYNDSTGIGFATNNPVMMDYSQGDTLWMHADTLRLETFFINTDSAYRKVHAYHKVRAYRSDIQAVCDSLVANSQDSCATMYKDPILWNGPSRQLLGEVIKVYSNDSTIRFAQVIGQALGLEQLPDSTHFNQLAAREMRAYFIDGNPRMGEAIGNVQSIYYPIDEKDSVLIGHNYLETDTMRMYMSPERKLQKIWASKSVATMYPVTQIPAQRFKLPSFAWFPQIRPIDKNDIFVWRGKGSQYELKAIKRNAPPLQKLRHKTTPQTVTADSTQAAPIAASQESTIPQEAIPAASEGQTRNMDSSATAIPKATISTEEKNSKTNP